MTLAIIFPHLSPDAGKALIIAGATAGIGGLYYMIVIPGMAAGMLRRSGTRCAMARFLALATLLAAAAGAFVVFG